MAVEQGRKLYKADMHMHSRYSGMSKHLKFLRCRDCYSKPIDVYRTAKKRGMDWVTITDHDSIDGRKELLDKHGPLPDFIMGEEVSTWFPEFRHAIHIGVYGLTKIHHREMQPLRKNGNELVAYLKEQNLLFALNHIFHDFAHTEHVRDYIRRMVELFQIFEVRNGFQQRVHSEFIEELLGHFRSGSGPRSVIAGSDAHTLRRIGRTYTASYATNREEFLEDIRDGKTMVFGRHSNHISLAGDIYGVVLRYYPHLFLPRRDHFPRWVRLKNMFLSLLDAAVPGDSLYCRRASQPDRARSHPTLLGHVPS